MEPVVTMRQLLEAGVHFGHQTRRWNPKMQRFIYGERNGIYLIDLKQTLACIVDAYTFVRDSVAGGGQVLFVGTKKQAQDSVQSYAERCGQPYINQRWLGGMLTNFETMSKRVSKMKEYQRMRDSGEFDAMPKKEALLLERNLGGIRNMERVPQAVFVLDTKKEHIAVTEANKLGLATIAVVDTNCDPDIITYIIPGNDDAIRSGDLMCRIICEAVEEGRLIAAKRDEAKMARTAEEEAEVAAQQEIARAEAAAAAAAREVRVAETMADDTTEATPAAEEPVPEAAPVEEPAAEDPPAEVPPAQVVATEEAPAEAPADEATSAEAPAETPTDEPASEEAPAETPADVPADEPPAAEEPDTPGEESSSETPDR